MEELNEPSGVLLLDKSAGMTSHDAVGQVRKLYGIRQVGHTGTLDPMATGVLPILLGRAAKASEYLLCEKKRYEAVLRLGLSTDTEDISGAVLSVCSDLPKKERVFEAASSFRGNILQIPPMYSALKIHGQKLCDLARKNIEVDRPARSVTVYALDIKALNEEEGLYALDVCCSKGTYIRTLCADIGKKLSCGGVMAALRRTESGSFSLSDALTLEQLKELSPKERKEVLLPVEKCFSSLPAVVLPPFFRRLCSSGCPIYLKKLGLDLPEKSRVRLYDGEKFFALGEVGVYGGEPAVKAVKQFVLYGGEERNGNP